MNPKDIERVERFLARKIEVEVEIEIYPEDPLPGPDDLSNDQVIDVMDLDGAIAILHVYLDALHIDVANLTPEEAEAHRRNLAEKFGLMAAIFKKFSLTRLLQQGEVLSTLESQYFEGVSSGKIKPSPELSALINLLP